MTAQDSRTHTQVFLKTVYPVTTSTQQTRNGVETVGQWSSSILTHYSGDVAAFESTHSIFRVNSTFGHSLLIRTASRTVQKIHLRRVNAAHFCRTSVYSFNPPCLTHDFPNQPGSHIPELIQYLSINSNTNLLFNTICAPHSIFPHSDFPSHSSR